MLGQDRRCCNSWKKKLNSEGSPLDLPKVTPLYVMWPGRKPKSGSKCGAYLTHSMLPCHKNVKKKKKLSITFCSPSTFTAHDLFFIGSPSFHTSPQSLPHLFSVFLRCNKFLGDSACMALSGAEGE